MISALVSFLISLYTWIVFARILLSWFPSRPYHPVVNFIERVTDPVLEPARRIIPPIGMLDISPIVVFMVLGWLRTFLVVNLMRLGL